MAEADQPPPQGDAQAFSAHITVKPPAFDETAVQRWFAVIESQFTISRITNNNTKFHHVIANIPVSVTRKLSDHIMTCNDYDELKEALINLYSRSNIELFDQFLSQMHLSSKPTALLQDIRSIARQLNLDEHMIKIKFLKSLPENIRPCLVSNHEQSLDELARSAEAILAFQHNNNSIVNYVKVPKFTNDQYPNNASFSGSVKYANNPFASSMPYQTSNQSQASSSYSSHSSFSYAHHSIPIGVRAFNAKQRPQVCRFHIYYGNKARSCKSWCILSSSSQNILPDSRPSSRSSSPIPRQLSEN